MRATERQRTTETPPTLRRPRSPGALHRLQSVTGTISNDSVESTGTHWRAGPRSRRVAFSEAAPAGVGRSTVDCSGVTLPTVVLCLFFREFPETSIRETINIRTQQDRQNAKVSQKIASAVIGTCVMPCRCATRSRARSPHRRLGPARRTGGAGRADTCDSHMSHDDMNLSYMSLFLLRALHL